MSTLLAIDQYLKELASKLNGRFDTEKTKSMKLEVPRGFEYRSIEWEYGGLNFQVEAFPSLTGENSQMKKWNFGYSVYFDEHKKRYFHKALIIENGPKKAIIENIQDLMDHTFRMTRDFGREDKSSFETILELDN